MEVIVLAGGLGTRLRSVVSDVPKCLAPVSGKPFLWYLFKYLTNYKVDRVVLSVGYLKEQIYKWIESCGETFPFEIIYAEELQPLGTGGAIMNSLTHIQGNDAVVFNGDTFFSIRLDKFFSEYQQLQAPICIALKEMADFDRYGTVELNEKNSKIQSFSEKKHCLKGLINGGIYAINKEFLLNMALPEKFSFETDVLQSVCGKDGAVSGTICDNYFIDIGVPSDYERAQVELIRNISHVSFD